MVETEGRWNGRKNRGREKNIERRGPKGVEAPKEKTHSKRVVSTKRGGSKREKTQMRKTTHDKIVVRN